MKIFLQNYWVITKNKYKIVKITILVKVSATFNFFWSTYYF